MNAYELAKYWDNEAIVMSKTTAMVLRQQADRIAELELQLGVEEYLHKKLATTKPLSYEEISIIHDKSDGTIDIIAFARAIEERHGIK